jgi:hypothetical protein
LKFLVQPVNDMYIYLTSFTFAIWYGSVGRLKLWKTYETLFFYLCVNDIDFASFYDFDIWFWNCSDSFWFLFFILNLL